MLTIRRLSLGKGYKYLMDSIARGDGATQQSSSLTRYYAESGTAPGIFLGSELAALGDRNGIEQGAQVGEENLYRMLALCADPLDGTVAGHASSLRQVTVAERIYKRMARLPAHLSEEERAARHAEIAADESERRCGAPRR